jgi:hypothetical protein
VAGILAVKVEVSGNRRKNARVLNRRGPCQYTCADSLALSLGTFVGHPRSTLPFRQTEEPAVLPPDACQQRASEVHVCRLYRDRLDGHNGRWTLVGDVPRRERLPRVGGRTLVEVHACKDDDPRPDTSSCSVESP